MRGLFGVAWGVVSWLWAQEKVVSGFAEVELLPGWSLERAQRQAYQLAIFQALQNGFPTQVARASKYLLENRTQGQNAQTRIYFYLTGDQYIGAEWLETLEARYQTEVRKGQVWVSCKVKGRARARTEPPLPLEVRTLRCRDTQCTTTDFWAGDPFYLYFRSPVEGYLQVFWEDSGEVYRLLPYQNQRMQAWPVRADTIYLFFAPDPKRRSEAFWTDELILTAEKPEVLHRVYVVFSRHPLAAPPERFNPRTGFHTVSLSDFQDWLLSERLRMPDLNLRFIDISVRQR